MCGMAWLHHIRMTQIRKSLRACVSSVIVCDVADHNISHLFLIIKRWEVRHNRLKKLGWWILKTASCLFVGVVLGGPEKAGCWPHPGVASVFTPVHVLWYGTVLCLLDLARYWQNREQS